MTEINTIHWLPAHIAGMREFQEITKAYDYLLQRAFTDLERVFNNQFLEKLEETGCIMHETVLGITPDVTDTLDDRKRRIRGYYASDLPYTENKLTAVLAAMCGRDGFEILVNAEEYHVDVMVKLNSVSLVRNVSDVVKQMVPANMTVDIRIIYNIHQRFLAFAQRNLGEYTHTQLRTDKIFQNQYIFYGAVGRYRHSSLEAYTHISIFQDDMEGENGKIY